MRQSIPTIIAIALIALLGGRLAAEGGGDYTIRVLAAAWYADHSGALTLNDSNDIETEDMDLDNAELTGFFEAGARLPFLVNLHGGLTLFETNGSFGSDQSSSALSDLYIEAAYGISPGLFGASVGLAIHSISTELGVEDSSARIDESTWAPALALRAFVAPVDQFDVEARLHYVDLTLGDDDVAMLDVDLRLGYYPSGLVALHAGWRFADYDIVYEEAAIGVDRAEVQTTLNGPFVAVGLQW